MFRKIALIFLIISSAAAYSATPQTATCRDSYVPVSYRLEAGESYRIASLAKTATGIYLIDGHYDALGHESLLNELAKTRGEIEHVYWEGEIVVAYPGRITGVRMANNTSRHFQEYQGGKSQTEVASLEDVLTSTGILHSDFQNYSYSKEHEHLDPALNDVNFNIRHDLATSLSIVLHGTKWFAGEGRLSVSFLELQKEMQDFFRGAKYFVEKGLLKPEEVPSNEIRDFLNLKTEGQLRNRKRKLKKIGDFARHFTSVWREYLFAFAHDYRVIKVR